VGGFVGAVAGDGAAEREGSGWRVFYGVDRIWGNVLGDLAGGTFVFGF